MRIAEYKQINTEIIEEVITVTDYDADTGLEVGQHEETVTKEKPIMGMVYRDATPEEEAEMLRQQAEFEEYERTRPRTPEERLEEVEPVAEMAYVNSEIALALLDMEV